MMPSVMAVKNLATLSRSAPTRLLHQQHHVTTEDLTQGTDTQHNQRDRSHSYYGPRHRRHYSRSQSHPIHTVAEAAALEGTPHALLPATTAAHTALQPMDAPITPHTKIQTGIVTPYPTLPISPADATHTTPLTGADLTPVVPTMQYSILSPGR